MSIPPKKITSQPSLRDAFNVLKREILLEVNCHAIATVQEFDSSKQTISATLNYSQTYYRQTEIGVQVAYQVEYPILLDCPVIILGGGQFHLTFPIVKGDQCLVLFNDRDIDNYIKSGKSGAVSEVKTSRLHSFSDAMALIGFNKVGVYDTTRAVLRYGDTGAMVGVSATKAKIANSTTSLGVILNNLNTTLTTLLATMGPSSVPITPYELAVSAGATAATAQIAAIQILVAGLLE